MAQPSTPFDLGLPEDALATCISCGLCLPHCPTWRVTGEESASPRGRIAAMRAVQHDGLPVDADTVAVWDACVQCRGCEPACPAGVPFGELIERTREALARTGRSVPRHHRVAYGLVGHHRVLLALSTLAAVAQRARLLPGRLGLPRLPVRRGPLHGTGDDVWLFTGCVADAWLRPVHRAAIDVLGAAGIGVALPTRGGDCCGALHVHAGLGDGGRRLLERTMRSMPGDAPVVVDAAGCGAQLRDAARLLGTAEAERFAARVVDVHELLATRLEHLPTPARRLPYPVAVQDPCHLRHVQGAHAHVRTVLEHYAEVVELDDEGLCCGAGGAYAAVQPELAGRIRARKVEAIARTGARVVASANPGCAFHLTGAGLTVRHPVELVAESLGPGVGTAAGRRATRPRRGGHP